MWITDLIGNQILINLFCVDCNDCYRAFCFTLPNVPAENKNSNQTLTSKFGLDILFQAEKMAIFFVFAMLLGRFQKIIL
jgi:NHS family xanthosine MFS transporter